MESKEYLDASFYFAHSSLPLEQVALLLLKIPDDHSALIRYLNLKLESYHLDEKLKSKCVMLSSWILELMLTDLDVDRDTKTKEKTKSFGVKSKVIERTMKVEEKIEPFLLKYLQILHSPTIYSLFLQHGQSSLVLAYARMIKDIDRIITWHMHAR
jgi:hypothetical protein